MEWGVGVGKGLWYVCEMVEMKWKISKWISFVWAMEKFSFKIYIRYFRSSWCLKGKFWVENYKTLESVKSKREKILYCRILVQKKIVQNFTQGPHFLSSYCYMWKLLDCLSHFSINLNLIRQSWKMFMYVFYVHFPIRFVLYKRLSERKIAG